MATFLASLVVPRLLLRSVEVSTSYNRQTSSTTWLGVGASPHISSRHVGTAKPLTQVCAPAQTMCMKLCSYLFWACRLGTTDFFRAKIFSYQLTWETRQFKCVINSFLPWFRRCALSDMEYFTAFALHWCRRADLTFKLPFQAIPAWMNVMLFQLITDWMNKMIG